MHKQSSDPADLHGVVVLPGWPASDELPQHHSIAVHVCRLRHILTAQHLPGTAHHSMAAQHMSTCAYSALLSDCMCEEALGCNTNKGKGLSLRDKKCCICGLGQCQAHLWSHPLWCTTLCSTAEEGCQAGTAEAKVCDLHTPAIIQQDIWGLEVLQVD